nr:NADH dehydrogenase subunit 3 [Homoderus mellyi]
MLLMLTWAIIMLMIPSIMMSASSVLSKKTFTDREKSSSFECGFDPKCSSRLPFSLQFFLIAMIFLIFDVEITLLVPLASVIKITKVTSFTLITSFFIIVLLGGLYHEWSQGALEWAI